MSDLRAELSVYADTLARGSGDMPAVDVAWKLRRLLAASEPDAVVVSGAAVTLRHAVAPVEKGDGK